MGKSQINIIKRSNSDKLTFSTTVLYLTLLDKSVLKLNFPVLLSRNCKENNLSGKLVGNFRNGKRYCRADYSGQLCVMSTAVSPFRLLV